MKPDLKSYVLRLNKVRSTIVTEVKLWYYIRVSFFNKEILIVPRLKEWDVVMYGVPYFMSRVILIYTVSFEKGIKM